MSQCVQYLLIHMFEREAIKQCAPCWTVGAHKVSSGD